MNCGQNSVSWLVRVEPFCVCVRALHQNTELTHLARRVKELSICDYNIHVRVTETGLQPCIAVTLTSTCGTCPGTLHIERY